MVNIFLADDNNLIMSHAMKERFINFFILKQSLRRMPQSPIDAFHGGPQK